MTFGRVYMLEKKTCRYVFLWLNNISMATSNLSGGCRVSGVFCSGLNGLGSSLKR
jgi:hypothetical protein